MSDTINEIGLLCDNILDGLSNIKKEIKKLTLERDTVIKSFAEYKQQQTTPFNRPKHVQDIVKQFIDVDLSSKVTNELILELFQWLNDAELSNYIENVFDNYCEKRSECCDAPLYPNQERCSECGENCNTIYQEV